jgi:hypothetical protein
VRFVIESDSAADPNGGCHANQGFGGSRDDPGARFERYDILDAANIFAKSVGQHAPELGCGSFFGRCEGGQTQVAQGLQAERKSKSLFIGKHERRKTETWFQLVIAADATHGLDRNAQILQPRDIALHGTRTYFEAFGEFGAAHMLARLKNFEDRQDSHDRVVHKINPATELRQRLTGILFTLLKGDKTMTIATEKAVTVLNADAVLQHWQGHRRLTRRTIEAFPEDKLFTFSVGGMRPFSEFILEFLKMAEPIARGVATGQWLDTTLPSVKTKAELLALWDKATIGLNEIWPTIPAHRFSEVDKAFGQWENAGIDTILYAIDNEIHHRGQGYVYLRALGIEPPHFWERN